jgi:hypothetical protein
MYIKRNKLNNYGCIKRLYKPGLIIYCSIVGKAISMKTSFIDKTMLYGKKLTLSIIYYYGVYRFVDQFKNKKCTILIFCQL